MVTDRMVLAFKVLFGFLYLICTIVYNVEIGAPSASTNSARIIRRDCFIRWEIALSVQARMGGLKY